MSTTKVSMDAARLRDIIASIRGAGANARVAAEWLRGVRPDFIDSAWSLDNLAADAALAAEALEGYASLAESGS